MKITIETIPLIIVRAMPSAQMRYPAWCGDWEFDDKGFLTVTVAQEITNPWHASLVAVHEIIEALLCRKRGITGEQIDAFCETLDRRREAGTVAIDNHDKTSPSHREHLFAENLERLLAAELGVDWESYGDALP